MQGHDERNDVVGLDRLTGNNTNGCTGTAAYTYDRVGRQRTNPTAAVHYDGLTHTVTAETPAGTTTDNNYILTSAGAPLATVTGTNPAAYLTVDGHGNITTTITTATPAAVTSKSGENCDC